MNRVKKRLAYLLAAVLFFALVAPAAPEVTAFAATKNAITELGIAELPEGNTIKVGEVFNFNPDILATELGRGKTTGIVWWEVNTQTNTAGVISSRWGFVYPVYAGSFEIRALAFANAQDMEAWKAARSANGKVADEAATASYVTAMTDWVKIEVVSDTEGYAVARSQYQLGLALKNSAATDIQIRTDKAVSFTIAAKSYTNRTLTVDAPNAEVENAGRFAQINIKQIKASTFYEKAYGNRFHVTAPDARIVFLNSARTSEVVFEPERTAEAAQLTLVGEGGTLSTLNIKAAGLVDIVGDIFADRTGNAVVVNVTEEAAGTSIQTAAALEVNAAADVAVTVNQAEGSEAAPDAPKTVINMEKAATVSVDGTAADGTTVVVKGEAKGSEIASDAALIIIADADIILNLTENAAGTTVAKGENVKVELSAQSTVDEVSVTDVNGEVETIKPGEDSAQVTAAPSATPVPSVTPVPTMAPSGGSSGSTPSYPVTPSTPTPTPTPTSTPTPTIDLAWLGEQGMELSPQGNFGFITSMTDSTQEATTDEIYVPANIVITESTEGVKEGYKTVTAVICLNMQNTKDAAGDIWAANAFVFDRYTGTSFGYFDPDEYLPSPPMEMGEKKEIAEYSVIISNGEETYDISREEIRTYNAYTYIGTIKITCPVDYDGVVFMVGKDSPELQKAAAQLALEKGQMYTIDELPYFGDDYFYFSALNSEFNDEYCGIYQEWMEDKYVDILTYSISGGTIDGEIHGEIMLSNERRIGAICYKNIDNATIKAKLIKAGEEVTVSLNDLVNLFSIGAYKIAVFNPNDPAIFPISVSAEYRTVLHEDGTPTDCATLILSARFDEIFNPQYQTLLTNEGTNDIYSYFASYGIRWCDPDGNVVAEVSWDPENQVWWAGSACDGDAYLPNMTRTIENGQIKDVSYFMADPDLFSLSADTESIVAGKGVDCAVICPVSQANDFDGYYADVVFWFSGASSNLWYTMDEKIFVENTVDAGGIYQEISEHNNVGLFYTHLSLWDSEHEEVTDGNYTAFKLKDGTDSFLFHVCRETYCKYLWYDPETKEIYIYAEEAVSMKVEDYLDITSGMVNYSPQTEYQFASASLYNGGGLAEALAATKVIHRDTYISVPSGVKGYLMLFDPVTNIYQYAISTDNLHSVGITYTFKPVKVSGDSEGSYVLINFVDGYIELNKQYVNPTFLITWNLTDSILTDEWIMEEDYIISMSENYAGKTFELGSEAVSPFAIHWDGTISSESPFDCYIRTASGDTDIYVAELELMGFESDGEADIDITFTGIPDTADLGEIITITMTASEECRTINFAGHREYGATSVEFEVGGNGKYWYIVEKDGKTSLGYVEINCFQ